jgi:hypothetical protein
MMTSNRTVSTLFFAAFVATIASVGCTKPTPDGASGATSASAAPSAAPSGSTAAAPSASASGSGSGAKASAYEGKYTTTAVTTITLPEGVKWKGEEGPEGVGEGKVSLDVGEGGRVTGTIDGVLGTALIEGLVEGDTFAATFRRKDATDNGFYGTLGGKIAGDKIEGTLAASRGNAGLVREGKFSLGKK